MNEEYWELRALARNYEDSKKFVIRLNNRLGALKRRGQTSEWLIVQRDLAEQAWKDTERVLVKRYKQTAPPAIVKFQMSTIGLGEGLTAQLVGCIGDFRTYTEAWWETAEDNSRPTDDGHLAIDKKPIEKRVLVTGAVRECGVRDIWAYCGHGDPSRRRKAGASQEDNFAAGGVTPKTIVHLMSDFAVRNNGVPDKNGRPRSMTPYYPLYVQAKADALARHPDWTKLHANNHGIRLVGKAILKDVWRVQHDQEPVYGAKTPWVDRRAV